MNGVGSAAERLIRSVQPYTAEAPDDTVLYVIQQYDNLDKHQLLIVVSTVMAIGDQITVSPKKGRDCNKWSRNSASAQNY